VRDRVIGICREVPTIVAAFLDRPAVPPEIAGAAAALLVDFGAGDDAVVDVLLGEAQARGLLPFDLPCSMQAVRDSRSDVPYDTVTRSSGSATGFSLEGGSVCTHPGRVLELD
jgi:beta-glucosidase